MQERSAPSIQELVSTPLLTAEEERELLRLAQAGDEVARQHLVLANLRWVLKIARSYASRQMPLEDCIGEGVLGLHKAIERFDLNRPYRFATYAFWWIRQSIQRAVHVTSKLIKTPTHAVTEIHRITICYAALEIELEREPTIAEIAERAELPADRVALLIDVCKEPLSLDAPCRESGITIGDMQSAPEPVEETNLCQLRSFVDGMMDSLTEAQRLVLTYRYGLDGSGKRSYRDVAQMMGRTRATIKNIEQDAIFLLQQAHELPERDNG